MQIVRILSEHRNIREVIRILRLYLRRLFFGKTWDEHVFSLKHAVRTGTRADEPRPFSNGVHPIDREYGISTSGSASFADLRSGHNSDAYATAYLGSAPSIIRASLKLAPISGDSTFIDLGCGEGRALVLASEFRFREIIGVELSPALCKIASSNAAVIASRFPERPRIRVVESDAGSFPIPTGKVVVYMANPFRKPVMKQVLKQLEGVSHKENSEVYVIYHNPVLGTLFDHSGSFIRYFAGMLEVDKSERQFSETAADAVVIWRSPKAGQPAPHTRANAGIRIRIPGARAELA